MPVLPSFSSFAATPDLAGAYLGGVRAAQDAVQHAATIQLQRQKLAQEAVANEMELQAKKEIAEKQLLQKQQEAEIQKSYREAQIGLREQQLDYQAQIANVRLTQAARELSAQRQYQRVRQSLLDQGVPDVEASNRAMREAGFGIPGFAGSLTEPKPPSPFPALNFEARQLSAQEQAILRKYPGYMAVTMSDEDKAKLEQIAQRRAALQPPPGFQAPTATATNAPPSVARPMVPPPNMATTASATNAPAPFREGQRIRNKKNGKLYEVRNGQPVEVKE